MKINWNAENKFTIECFSEYIIILLLMNRL